MKKNCFGPIKTLFSTAQTEKNSWKKIMKQINEFVMKQEENMAEPDEYELTEDELNDWESACTPREHSQNNMDFSRFSDHFLAHENTIASAPRNSLSHNNSRTPIAKDHFRYVLVYLIEANFLPKNH